LTLNDRHAEPQFSWQILCYANSWCKAKWCKAKGEVGAAPTNTPPVRLIQNCFCHKNSENNATRPLFKLNALSLTPPLPQTSPNTLAKALRQLIDLPKSLFIPYSLSWADQEGSLCLCQLSGIFLPRLLSSQVISLLPTPLWLWRTIHLIESVQLALLFGFGLLIRLVLRFSSKRNFLCGRRPFDHFILLDSTFAHDLWQPFTLIENVTGDVALWYRPGAPTYFAVPFEKTPGLFSSAYAPRNRSEHTNHPFIFSSVLLRWLVEAHILAR
jgi:hypothetical protein